MAATVKPCSIAFEIDVLAKLDPQLQGVSRSKVVNEILKYVMQTPTYIPGVVNYLKSLKEN